MIKILHEISIIQEKSSHVQYIRVEAKIHGYTSSLAVRIVQIESSLETEKKYRLDTVFTVVKMKSCVDETLGTHQHEKESRAKDPEACVIG